MTSPTHPIDVQPVVMAGGSGTRLWPLSRAGYPKQFLALTDSPLTLFQQALERVQVLEDADIHVAPALTVCNEEHRFLVLDQLRESKVEGTLLLEPAGRNTAPAVTLAALQATQNGRDPVLVVKAADHTVTDLHGCKRALQAAVREAAKGRMVVLGITPTHPETGYGYIKASTSPDGAAKVHRFVEKPAATVAAQYLQEGGYTWNSGIFVMKASVWLAALNTFAKDIFQATRAAFDHRKQDNAFVRPDKAMFEKVRSESVDYAVMQDAPTSAAFDVRVVPLDAGWSDLGAWDAVWQVARKDSGGNAAHGDAVFVGASNSMAHATSRLVGVVGVSDVVVVETPDAVLVLNRNRAQDVKAMVSTLEAKQRSEKNLHRKVHRPWGWYDSLDHGERHQVKRIMVKPGASLSLQMHHHRAEHWIVVRGVAEVTNGDQVLTLNENQSTYIPQGQRHRLRNVGSEPLHLIEVQSGTYLGEDDIVRFEDTYGRS
jgi:mannose-1-phosphate guanylyltransferase / mannose-6-phosphate isomerase